MKHKEKKKKKSGLINKNYKTKGALIDKVTPKEITQEEIQEYSVKDTQNKEKLPNETGNKKNFLFLLRVSICLLLVIGIVSIAYWSYIKAPASISAGLTNIDEIKVTLPDPKEKFINPAGGSNINYFDYKNDPSYFRGVGFFADSLTLSAEIKNEYSIICPPTNVNGYSTGFAFSARIIRFKAQNVYSMGIISIDPGFSPDKLMNPNFNHPNIIEKRKFDSIYEIKLDSDSDLHITQVGEIPFCILNPTTQTSLILKYLPNEMQISEPEKSEFSQQYGRRFLLDFTAQTYLMWFTSEAHVTIDEKFKFTAPKQTKDYNECIAIILDTPYILRVGIEGRRYDKSNRLSIQSSIEHNKNMADALSKAKKYFEENHGAVVKNNDGVWSNIINKVKLHPDNKEGEKFSKDSDYLWHDFPYLPNGHGFSIYGDMIDIKMNNVRGSIIAEQTSFNFGAPTSLQLNDIQELQTNEPSITFMPELETFFKLRANEIKVDNKVAYRNIDKYFKEISIAGFVIAILGIFLYFLPIKNRVV